MFFSDHSVVREPLCPLTVVACITASILAATKTYRVSPSDDGELLQLTRLARQHHHHDCISCLFRRAASALQHIGRTGWLSEWLRRCMWDFERWMMPLLKWCVDADTLHATVLSCSHCSGLVVQVDFLFVWCFFLCNICVRVCNWECVCNYCDAYNTTARLDVYIIYYCDASNWMSVCWALISLVISLDIKYIWVVVSQLLSWNLLHRQCSRAYTTSFHLLGIKQTPSLNWERWYKYSIQYK